MLLEPVGQVRPQFMNIKFGSVNDQVGNRAKRPQMPPLGPKRCPHRRALSQRMRPPRLAVAPQQRGVTRFQINHPRRYRQFHRLQDRWQFLELRTLAHIHYQRRPRDLSRPQRQFGKPRNQLHRQIVHAVVAKIFKSLQRRSLPRPAHASDDDEFRRVWLALAPTSFSHCGLSRRVHDLLEFAAQWHAGNLSISAGVKAAKLQMAKIYGEN